MVKLAVLASTKGTDLQAVVDAIKTRQLDAEIVCVISNKQDAYALERARKNNIEAIFLDPKKFDSEESYDKEIIKLLKKRNTQLVLLIGYNKILTSSLVKEFENKIMNIHPSLLPSFKGWNRKVHQSVLDRGCKVSGATLFFVTEEPDSGPIIAQKAVDIKEDETIDSLKEKVQKAEQEIILRAIKLFSENRLEINKNKVRIR